MSSADQVKKRVAPAAAERFVKQLNIAFKAVKLYPLSSAIPRDSARSALEALRVLMQKDAEVQLDVAKEGLQFGALPIYGGHPAFEGFALEFYNRGIAEVHFHAGTTADEIVRFLSVLDLPPAEIAGAGGVEARLWDLQVNNITVKEIATRVIDAAPSDDDEPWPPDARVVDEVLTQAMGRRPRGQRLLVRLVNDRPALQGFLLTPPAAPEGGAATFVARRIGQFARAVRAESPVERGRLYAELGAAVGDLAPEVVHDVLAELLDEARHDETVASVVRSIALEEICRDLVAQMAFDEVTAENLARTIRNLVALGMAPRADTMAAMGGALQAAGAPAEYAQGVLDAAMPSHLRVRERPKTTEKPEDIVLRLLDMAATNTAAGAHEVEDVEDLAAEAAAGITDGDVFRAVATLATLEERPEHFADLMAMLENNLPLLIERNDFQQAADAAEELMQAQRRPLLTEAQRRRIRATVVRIAQPSSMRVVTTAMRVHGPGSSEYESCLRLLDILGETAVTPILEVLAEEKDMTARKALVDLLSAMADRFIDVLGEHVGDTRWFVVRNVVSILGATRSPNALPYLARTLRHADSRVRRETIRSLSGIRNAYSDEMLVAALSDDDAANVQLAARHLGTLRLRVAVPGLEKVARGEGKGNRDGETRVEAVNALGRIGAPESAGVLQSIARQRSLRASRTRDLRAAAERALAALKSASAGAGE